MQPQTIDVPVWLGVLMFLTGLAVTIAMGKWVAHNERKRKGITTKS